MKAVEYLSLFCKRKNKNKYNAIPTVLDGIRFASGREAKRYQALKLLERAGEISDLELQPQYKLGTDDNPVLIRSRRYRNGRRASYRADFRYRIESTGETVVEDSKGVDTPASRLRRAFVEWQYQIRIVLT